jgi:hypothetical protein
VYDGQGGQEIFMLDGKSVQPGQYKEVMFSEFQPNINDFKSKDQCFDSQAR